MRAILGRHQQSKLMAIASGAAQKLANLGVIASRIVGSTGRSVAAHAGADDIPNVQLGCIEITGNHRIPHPDDDAALPGRDQAGSGAAAGTQTSFENCR